MWVYHVTRGILFHDAVFEGVGYSGHAAGLNNPGMESIGDIGPIPQGRWHIMDWIDHPTLGPCVAQLNPIDHDAHGRIGFFIHGAHQGDHYDSWHGCIVLGPSLRHLMRDSGDHEMTVAL